MPVSTRIERKLLAVLTGIQEYVEQNGFPPSFADLVRLTGVSDSKSMIRRYAQQLQVQGLATYDPARQRTLLVTDRGRELLAKQGKTSLDGLLINDNLWRIID